MFSHLARLTYITRYQSSVASSVARASFAHPSRVRARAARGAVRVAFARVPLQDGVPVRRRVLSHQRLTHGRKGRHSLTRARDAFIDAHGVRSRIDARGAACERRAACGARARRGRARERG